MREGCFWVKWKQNWSHFSMSGMLHHRVSYTEKWIWHSHYRCQYNMKVNSAHREMLIQYVKTQWTHMHAHTTHTRGILYVKNWHSDCYYKCVDVDSNCLAKNDSLTTSLSSTSIIYILLSKWTTGISWWLESLYACWYTTIQAFAAGGRPSSCCVHIAS